MNPHLPGPGTRDIDVETLAGPHDAVVIDVREADEFVAGHVPGAQLLPMSQITARVDELDRSRPLYVLCAVGQRSAAVVEYLLHAGFDAYNVAGGTYAWQRAGRPLETGLE